MDSHGRRVANLAQNDFAISSDNVNRKIDYFASGTDRVALMFAIDVSGSTRAVIAQQRQAAAELYSKFGGGSRVAVLQFSDVVKLTVGFTTNMAAATSAFDLRPAQNTGTAIFDAAATAVRAFDGRGGYSTERRIVILMSDGLDTLSSTRYQNVVATARERGVSFYVIHFSLFAPNDGVLAPRPPAKGFRELAEQTGGRYFRIGNAKSALNPKTRIDLTQVFRPLKRICAANMWWDLPRRNGPR
jgi:VWFA-related protein